MDRIKAKALRLWMLGFVLVAIDQIIKVLVKTHMTLGVPQPVLGNWFQLVFVENAGMAFGMGSEAGVSVKLCLTVFRILLFGFLVWWISSLLRKKAAPTGVLVGLTLVTAGALGNIIDSMFYGVIWPELTVQGAPFGFLFGKVVDMFWFPLIKNAAGKCIFFKPVFNFADSCVTVGAAYLLLFQYRFFTAPEKKEEDSKR